MKKLLIYPVFLILASMVNAQNMTEKELLTEAEYFFRFEEYEEALYYYLQLYRRDTANANYNYKVGQCYLKIPKHEVKAIPYLEKAIENINPKYRRRSIKETAAPPHAIFYLGKAYRINNQLDKALRMYEKFTSLPYFESNYNITIVENEIKATERAKIIKDRPIKVDMTVIEGFELSPSDNLNAVVSADEKHMVYITQKKFYDAIMYTKKIGNEWMESINITPQVKSDGNLYPTYLSNDGKTLLMVKVSKKGNDIFISHRQGKKWDEATPVSEKINSRANEDHASLSSDGRALYFSSDRKGGLGGYDIYSSEKDQNGKWMDPKNLGEPINTSSNEMTPFITSNDSVLVYSSNGLYTMGGFDVFHSHIRRMGIWSVPSNIGFPVNTTNDDLFYYPLYTYKEAYMSRYDLEEERNKIYKIEVLSRFSKKAPEETIQKVDLELPEELILYDQYAKDTVGTILIKKDGSLRFQQKSDQYKLIR
jgi:hypothetical protein